MAARHRVEIQLENAQLGYYHFVQFLLVFVGKHSGAKAGEIEGVYPCRSTTLALLPGSSLRCAAYMYAVREPALHGENDKAIRDRVRAANVQGRLLVFKNILYH